MEKASDLGRAIRERLEQR